MTIPLDNLYDYIFSLTGHTNKNLIMYRFDPHGSKNIKNLIVHNNADDIFVDISMSKQKASFHYKSIFCFDQEPLNFDLYAGNYFDNSRKNLFYDQEGKANQFNNEIGKKLIKKENIAGHPQVLPSVYDKKLLLHSEKNSLDLKKYEENGFLGIYYWSHAFLALDWYRFAEHDKDLDYSFTSSFRKDFNIYCRAWTGTREYRLKFLSILKCYNIDEDSNIFFNDYTEDGKNFDAFKPENNCWEIEKNKVKNLKYIASQNSKSFLSAVYTSTDYHNSAMDVVLETVFDQNKIQLTEKILRPIACGKPFILVSEKGSLEYLKSYGFKTFNDLIDESYDDIECPKKRLEKIAKIMKSISLLSQDEKDQLFYKMHKIAEFNKKWFFSEEFFNIINNELEQNLKIGLEILDNPEYQTAKMPRFHYRAYKRYRDYFDDETKLFVDTIITEFPERIELSRKNIGIS